MSEAREFYAATVEEAVDKALAALNVGRDELEFKVLDRGSVGFLGIGARDARILIEYPEPRIGAEFTATTFGGRSESVDEEEVSPVEEVSPTNEVSARDEVSPREGQPVALQAGEESEPSTSSEAPYELIVAADHFMTALVDAMGFDATVDAYDSGEVISVDVAVEDAGLFIGHKGETIDAVQFLLNVAVYKDRPFLKRIVVDSEGYRKRRIEAIQGMAHRTARRALKERRPLSLPPMPPAERRVVHLFLKENPNVRTFSDGQEENRRVIVSPA